MLEVLTENFTAKPVNVSEVLRYSGIPENKNIDKELLLKISEVTKECLPKLKYSVCYAFLPIKVNGNVDFGFTKVESKSLSAHLAGCDSAVIFAATIGLEIDRLIYKYGKISPFKSLILQALGTERVESLCDDFCDFIGKQCEGKSLKTKTRFSAGYGDFPLSFQKDIFAVLKPENKIMLTLGDSLIMSPSKSVTGVIGIGKTENCNKEKCNSCDKADCLFRRK